MFSPIRIHRSDDLPMLMISLPKDLQQRIILMSISRAVKQVLLLLGITRRRYMEHQRRFNSPLFFHIDLFNKSMILTLSMSTLFLMMDALFTDDAMVRVDDEMIDLNLMIEVTERLRILHWSFNIYDRLKESLLSKSLRLLWMKTEEMLSLCEIHNEIK